MNRQCYRPEVVVWNFREADAYVSQIRALGVPLHAFPDALSGAAKLRIFRQMVRHIQPEVVHSYTFYTNLAAWWATVGTTTVAIGAVRSDLTLVRKNTGVFLGRLSARWPRSQIFNNVAATHSVSQSRSLFVPKQLFVVRNSLDLQYFRRAPGPTARQICIVGIGSLCAIKRWDRLLRAACTLKQRGLDFLIRLVGDGPLRQSLQQQAQSLGVADSVEFIPYSSDIAGILAEASFLVHPSDSEGCPNVVMEAMACGRAVVATDVGDVPALVEDGKTGFVVRRQDEAMLAARMATLMVDSALCSRMGAAGRRKAEQEFGLDRLVAETLAAYRATGWEDA
jgi:glycosyltransferase involved in cell wall biosynthesis